MWESLRGRYHLYTWKGNLDNSMNQINLIANLSIYKHYDEILNKLICDTFFNDITWILLNNLTYHITFLDNLLSFPLLLLNAQSFTSSWSIPSWWAPQELLILRFWSDKFYSKTNCDTSEWLNWTELRTAFISFMLKERYKNQNLN